MANGLTELTHIRGLTLEQVEEIVRIAQGGNHITQFAGPFPGGLWYYEKFKTDGTVITFNQMQNAMDAVQTQALANVAANQLKQRKWNAILAQYGIDGITVAIARAGVSGDWSTVQAVLNFYDSAT